MEVIVLRKNDTLSDITGRILAIYYLTMAIEAASSAANWVELARQIRNGDDQGTTDLYAALAAPLRARLSRVVSPEEVEDSLHEVVVIVLGAIRRGEVRDPARLPGFVHTITRRRMVAHIRRRIFQRSVHVDGVEMVASHDHSPEEHLARHERIEQMTRVLRRLNARDREILERFYLREQRAEQICREMRLTETQFRLFKSRAIARCSDLAHARRPASRVAGI